MLQFFLSCCPEDMRKAKSQRSPFERKAAANGTAVLISATADALHNFVFNNGIMASFPTYHIANRCKSSLQVPRDPMDTIEAPDGCTYTATQCHYLPLQVASSASSGRGRRPAVEGCCIYPRVHCGDQLCFRDVNLNVPVD